MKRSILVVAVIALLAVAVFGGQALAAKPSGDNWRDMLFAKLESIEATLADVPRIEWGDAYDLVSEDVRCVGDVFPEIRHWSITVYIEGIDEPDDRVDITMQLDDREVLLYQVQTNGFKTFEFDATNCNWCFYDYGGDPIEYWLYGTFTWWEGGTWPEGYPEGSPLRVER